MRVLSPASPPMAAHSPRRNVRKEEHQWMTATLLEAQQLEALRKQHEDNARVHRSLWRGWVSLLFCLQCRYGERHALRWHLMTGIQALRRHSTWRKTGRDYWLRLQVPQALRFATLCRWRHWAKRAKGLRCSKQCLAIALNAWRNRGSVIAICRWRPLGRHRAALRRGLLALLARASRRALNAWVEAAALRRRAQQLLYRAGLTFTHRLILRLLNGYLDYAAKRRRALLQIAKAVGAFTFRLERRGMNTWLEWLRLRASLRQRRLVCVSAICNVERRRSLNSWKAMASDRAEMHAKLRRGVLSIRNARQRRAWNSCREAAAGRRRAHELLHISVARLYRRGQARGFASWAARSASSQRSLQRLSLAVVEWARLGPRRPWLKWQSVAQLGGKLRVALRTMMLRGLRAGMNGWLASARDSRRSVRLARQALTALCDRERRRSLNSWKAMASDRAEMHAKLRRGVLSIRLHGLRFAISSWVAAHRRCYRTTTLVSAAVRGSRHCKQRRVLHTWAVRLRMRAVQHKALYFAIATLAHNQVVRGLQTWARDHRARHNIHAATRVLALKARISSEAAAAALFRVWTCSLLVWTGRGWRAPRRAQTLRHRAAAHMAQRTLRGVLRLWKGQTRRILGVVARQAAREVRELRTKLSAAHAVEAMAAQLPAVTAERDALQSQVAEMQATTAAARHDAGELRDQLETLRKALADEQARRAAVERAKHELEEAERAERLRELEAARRRELAALETARQREQAELETVRQREQAARDALVVERLALSRSLSPAPRVERRAGLQPVATVAVDPEGQIVAAQVHLEDVPQATAEAQPSASPPMETPVLRIAPVRSPSPMSAGVRRTTAPRTPTRSTSPRPTNASRGWRMQFSPDWKTDGDAQGWQDSRRALIGRTAAVHHPWVQSPREPSPASGARRPAEQMEQGTPTEYRLRKRELEEHRALPGDPMATVAYRSAFAWSQHAFGGGHYKTAKD